MMEIEVIYGQVVTKSNNYLAVSAVNGQRRIIKNDSIRAYEDNFIKQCRIYKGKLINCKFKLLIAVYHSSTRFDLDNSLKTVLDCLQAVKAITNDNLCYSIIAEKRISKTYPRIEFSIQELEPEIF